MALRQILYKMKLESKAQDIKAVTARCQRQAGPECHHLLTLVYLVTVVLSLDSCRSESFRRHYLPPANQIYKSQPAAPGLAEISPSSSQSRALRYATHYVLISSPSAPLCTGAAAARQSEQRPLPVAAAFPQCVTKPPQQVCSRPPSSMSTCESEASQPSQITSTSFTSEELAWARCSQRSSPVTATPLPPLWIHAGTEWSRPTTLEPCIGISPSGGSEEQDISQQSLVKRQVAAAKKSGLPPDVPPLPVHAYDGAGPPAACSHTVSST